MTAADSVLAQRMHTFVHTCLDGIAFHTCMLSTADYRSGTDFVHRHAPSCPAAVRISLATPRTSVTWLTLLAIPGEIRSTYYQQHIAGTRAGIPTIRWEAPQATRELQGDAEDSVLRARGGISFPALGGAVGHPGSTQTEDVT